jgi:hypothetical protein
MRFVSDGVKIIVVSGVAGDCAKMLVQRKNVTKKTRTMRYAFALYSIGFNLITA